MLPKKPGKHKVKRYRTKKKLLAKSIEMRNSISVANYPRDVPSY